MSLRNTGYKGKLFVFVNKSYVHTNLVKYFSIYNATPLLLESEWPFYSELNLLYPISKSMLINCMIPYRDYSPFKWQVYRFSLAFCFFKKYGFSFSYILFSDSRDVLFQRNPFSWNMHNYLYLVEETDLYDYCIGINKSNFKWIKPYKDAYRVYNCRILNSGVLMGSIEHFLEFLKIFNQFIRDDYIKTAEQGSLNYFFYTHNLSKVPILVNRNGFGFALTLAVELREGKNPYLFPRSDMIIYNKDGSIPCFIHQYDRRIDKYSDMVNYLIHK